jgi:hypothetical protein
MTVTTERPALGPDDPLAADVDLPDLPDVDDELDDDEDRPVVRLAICIVFPMLAAAAMVGGIFSGASPRVYASVAGLLGITLAAAGAKLRKPLLVNAVVLVGMFGIGLLLVIPSGFDNLLSIRQAVADARAHGNVLRPPVPLEPGWIAIIGWLMGILGFTAGWVAFVLRKPALALMLPLPVAGIAAISVPKSVQVPSGIAVLALFAMGLGLLSGAQAFGKDDERPPVSYEVRRALRSVPIVAVITVLMYLLSQANFLFPSPRIDPTHQPQRPRTVPLSKVQDRVLFEVRSSITGPWRIGSLDVYDGTDWRLPPFAESQLKRVPRDGIVDHDLQPGVRAEFTISGLKGAVLPNLPNPVGIVAEGPTLSYDGRSGNIRTTEGDIATGLKYTVAAAALPSLNELRRVSGSVPDDLVQFTEIPDPPPAVTALIARAPKTSTWDEFNFLRTYVLDNVTVTGAGVPTAVPPSRVQDMLAGKKEGSPFEIVAAQAMLARWMHLPSRIGYGFDGGEKVGDALQVRPRHGATFVEVYFPTFKWLPVIGTPKHAKATIGKDGEQQTNPSVLPSNDISVQLFLPVLTPPKSILVDQVRRVVLIVVPSILFLLLLYFSYPGVYKAVVRGRRRRAALAAGVRARIALAYAEWRDYAADYGYRYGTDTPLMFLDRFVDDDEHTEFAWLATRALWGDLDPESDEDLATAAEELSRTLRRRLAQAQPGTLRALAVISRLSMRYPYAPETDLSHQLKARRGPDKEKVHELVDA